MQHFRDPQIVRGQDAAADWTRAHGFADSSEFPFPEVVLSEGTASLLAQDATLAAYLDSRLLAFAQHDYGGATSLEQVDNLAQRELLKLNTWMWSWWDTPHWGRLFFYVLYDVAIFFLQGESVADLMSAQRQKERATKSTNTPDTPRLQITTN